LTRLQFDFGSAAPETATESRHGESRLVRKAVLAAQQGDREALHFLYVRYAPDVLCQVRSLMRGGVREAEVITQNVFSDLTATIGTYEARKGHFLAWLSGVAHEATLEHLDSMRNSASRSV
jgi:DNA-directed RNA polymerase specialized sigma24 family protein